MFLNMLLAICKNETIIDLVFDSLKEGSVKDTEKSRGSTVKHIDISMIIEDTPLSVNMDTFWASVSNKSKLQMFLRKGVVENAENTCPEVEILSICFCVQNMSFSCQSLADGCLMLLLELDLTQY